MLPQKAGPHHQHGGGEVAARPQVALVHQDPAPTLDHQARGPWLGHPGAVELARAEGLQRLGIVLRHNGDITAAVDVGVEALRGQPGAKRHVLGTAELRIGQPLAAKPGRRGDRRLDHQQRAARGRARDDPDRLSVHGGLGTHGR